MTQLFSRALFIRFFKDQKPRTGDQYIGFDGADAGPVADVEPDDLPLDNIDGMDIGFEENEN